MRMEQNGSKDIEGDQPCSEMSAVSPLPFELSLDHLPKKISPRIGLSGFFSVPCSSVRAV